MMHIYAILVLITCLITAFILGKKLANESLYEIHTARILFFALDLIVIGFIVVRYIYELPFFKPW